MTKEIQLRLNAEEIAGEQYNVYINGDLHCYPTTEKSIIADFYTELFNIKVSGAEVNGKVIATGNTTYGDGICDDLKFLGEQVCKDALIEAFVNEGLVILIE